MEKLKNILSMSTNYNRIDSAHILYVFENIDYYVENLLAFIDRGTKKGSQILVIESPEINKELQKRFMKNPLLCQELVHFVSNQEFYGTYGDFNISSILAYFNNLLKPFLKNNINLWSWSHVDWQNEPSIDQKLESFELQADHTLENLNMLSVCTYDALKINASLQTTLMRSHEYFMTDQFLVKSSLYPYR